MAEQIPPARARVGLLTALLLGLSGCTSLPRPPTPEVGWSAPLQAGRVELSHVPFFPQQDDECGPAALATVLGAAGIRRTPEQLAPQVYLPRRQGSLQIELLGASRRAGAVPYVLAPRPAELLREVAAGHPVVVLQNLRWALLPQWHYAVVVGYDLDAGTLTLRSGTFERLVMPLEEFDRTWTLGERWAFVALPPGRLPATAREADYVAAVAALERVVPEQAPSAYESALQAWPANLFARLALGNAAYRQRQLEAAITHYRRATLDHPDTGDAWNNLAQALSEQGEAREALEAARRAVAAGGPRLATYAATLERIEEAASTTSPSSLAPPRVLGP